MSQELWNALAQRAGLTLDARHHAQINSFLDLLLSANQRMNLTRITDRGQAEILHVADALTLLPHLLPRPHRLTDVGSGGGIPGIILAIVRADAQIVLIEGTQKKANFLRMVARELNLANVTVEPLRAEEVCALCRARDFRHRRRPSGGCSAHTGRMAAAAGETRRPGPGHERPQGTGRAEPGSTTDQTSRRRPSLDYPGRSARSRGTRHHQDAQNLANPFPLPSPRRPSGQ